MPRLLRSAAYRIALIYALGFALATLALGVAVVHFAHVAILRQLEAQVIEDAGTLAADYRARGHDGLNFGIAEREAANTTNDLLYAVYAPDGRRIAGALRARRPPPGWSDLPFEDRLEGPDLARAWAIDLSDGSRLVVAADRSVIERVDRTLGGIVLGAFAAVLLLSIAGALILGAYLRVRLAAISGAADRIIAGDMDQRVPESGDADEFDRLAHTVNRMLDRIAALVDNLRQVSGDIAHDLRTPLARLRNHLEQGLIESESGGPQRQRLESALAQADGVLALFAAILRISEVEEGRRQAEFRRFDLAVLTSEVVESYAPAVEEEGRILTARLPESAFVRGDPDLLAQAIVNLLDNAQIHTPVGTWIAVDLTCSAEEVAISVSDNGPGVPEAAREAIFRRFVRLDRSASVPGHGLGLNLVAAIVTAHGGSIDCADNRPGLRIGFRLANAEPAGR